jgi:hypothetical protein
LLFSALSLFAESQMDIIWFLMITFCRTDT